MKNDFGDLSDSDKSSLFGGNSDNNGDKKTPPEKIIDMSGNGANEVRRLYLRMINIQFRKYMTVVC